MPKPLQTSQTRVAHPVSNPPRTPHYAAWLTKQQAADHIGVSTKAIERFARAKKLEQAFRPQAGSPDVAVYQPDDVARLALERRPAPAPFVMPPSTDTGQQLARRPLPAGDLWQALLTAMSQTSSQTPALFLTIAEAADASGLSQAYLRRLIADGKLPAIRDRGWRIRRRDLEAL